MYKWREKAAINEKQKRGGREGGMIAGLRQKNRPRWLKMTGRLRKKDRQTCPKRVNKMQGRVRIFLLFWISNLLWIIHALHIQRNTGNSNCCTRIDKAGYLGKPAKIRSSHVMQSPRGGPSCREHSSHASEDCIIMRKKTCHHPLRPYSIACWVLGSFLLGSLFTSCTRVLETKWRCFQHKGSRSSLVHSSVCVR